MTNTHEQPNMTGDGVRDVHAQLMHAGLPADLLDRISEPETQSLNGWLFWVGLGEYKARFENLGNFGFIVEKVDDPAFLRGRSLDGENPDSYLDETSPLAAVAAATVAELRELAARAANGTLDEYGIDLT